LWGCVDAGRRETFERKLTALISARTRIAAATYTPRELSALGLKINQDGSRRNGYQVLSLPDVKFDHLIQLAPDLNDVDGEVQIQLEKDALYSNYIARQERDVALMQRDEAHVIPKDFDYQRLDGLSNELKAKLQSVRPANLSHAARIDGMTPAALTLLLSRLRSGDRARSG
jgi:tRNA uridine 5-carboxymethylaminomethyl modification enzyme